MGLRRCSRCGRLRPRDDAFVEPAQGRPQSSAGQLGGLPRIWTSFEGEDVCPDCQTPLERRDAALRALASVEAEVERRRHGRVPPDAVESALVSYALSLREALEGESDPSEDVASASAESPGTRGAKPGPTTPEAAAPIPRDLPGPDPHLEPRGRTEFQVAVTGAFLTGTSLAIRIVEYRNLQSALADALRRPGWKVRRLDREAGTYESGGGFVEPIPLVVARRDGAELLAQLRYGIEGANDPTHVPIAHYAPGYDFDPKGLQIDVYDLGVAVITAWFDVSAPAAQEPVDLTRTVKRVAWLRSGNGRSPIANALQEIAHDTVQDYGRAVRTALKPESIQRPWLGQDLDSGRLLWLHPLHVVEEAHPSRRSTKQLAPVFHQTMRVNNGVFAPGIGWSAVKVVSGSDGAATPVRLTQLHWAYFALYMELDRGLLGILNEARSSKNSSLKDLEREAHEAFRVYLRVMEARARLDTELSALGGDELAIWEAISKVQRFDAVVDAVERKIDVLQRLTQRRADQAVARRTRGISETLAFLGALGVVTVAVAVVGYLLGARTYVEGYDDIRLVVIVAALLAAAALAWFAFRGRRDRYVP